MSAGTLIVVTVLLCLGIGSEARALRNAGEINTPGDARSVVVSNGLAYVADSSAFRIIDVSDPGAPNELGSIPATDCSNLVVVGTVAYIDDSIDDSALGLRTVDVADPHTPVELDALPTPGLISDIDVEGGYAYIAISTSVRVIDVSDPTALTELGFVGTSSSGSLAAHGTYVYTRDAGDLAVIDVSDPSMPVKIGGVPMSGSQIDHAVVDDRLFVSGSSGLFAFDIGSPTSPVEIGSLDTGFPERGFDIADGFIYVTNGTSGITAIDATDPTNLIQMGTLDTPSSSSNIDVVGPLAFVANGDDGLWIVDVSFALAPAELGVLELLGYTFPSAVDVVGQRAYVAGDETFIVVGVADPEEPIELGSVPLVGTGEDVEVAGGLAYVATWPGLRVIDVSTPGTPVKTGQLATPGLAQGVAVQGSLVFIADGVEGLRIVDVSNSASPVEIGALDTPGTARDVFVVGDLAYLADNGAMRIIDVSDTSSPTELGSYPSPGSAMFEVEVVGSTAYVAASSSGLRIVDISNPALPVEIGALIQADRFGRSPARTDGLEVVGDIVFTLNGVDGVRAVDVSNPSVPAEIGGIDGITSLAPSSVGGGAATSIAAEGSRVYVPQATFFDGGQSFFSVYEFGPEYASAVPAPIQRGGATTLLVGLMSLVTWLLLRERAALRRP